MTDADHPPDASTAGRQGDLIDRVLAGAPSRRVLDLACGTGERARRLARQGFEVVAIDASEKALEQARAEAGADGVELLLGDMGAVERLVTGHFGAALCLGNALPHLLSPESVTRLFVGLRRRLLPGAPLLLQVLRYDGIPEGEVRALPVEVVEDRGGTHAVVRLLEPRGDGIVVHTTSTLRYQPAAEPLMELVEARAAPLRGWTRPELETMLDVARFSPREVYGDLAGALYDPRESLELVMVVD